MPIYVNIESFKYLLVKRYNWSVTRASLFNDDKLNVIHNEGSHYQDAYFKIFNVEQDLQST